MTISRMEYDVIIVGAGPGGATAAKDLVSKGFNVLMIDKKRFPRDKTCGGFIPTKVLGELGFSLPEELICNHIHRVSVYGRGLKVSSYDSDTPLGCTIPRIELDQFLVNKAIGQGVRFMDDTSFYHLEKESTRLKIYTSSGVFYCKSLIGSDGVFSKVRNYVEDHRQLNPYKTGFTLSTRLVRYKEDENNDFKLLSIPVAFSMGWAIPMGEQVNVGIGGPLFKKQDLLKEFQNYITRLNEIYKLENTKVKIRGGFLPAGGFQRQLVKERILLVGDAGGFADPLTGEGIYYAIRSGKIAAEQIEQGNLQLYGERCEREFNPRFRRSLYGAIFGLGKKYMDIKRIREYRCQLFAKLM